MYEKKTTAAVDRSSTVRYCVQHCTESLFHTGKSSTDAFRDVRARAANLPFLHYNSVFVAGENNDEQRTTDRRKLRITV